MKHTNGPWHICQTTGRYIRYIRDEKGYCIAEVIKPQNSSASYIDVDANAQLIAAAPDLLDVLEWWQTQMQDDNCDDMSKLLDDMSAKAYVAITKAKGA